MLHKYTIAHAIPDKNVLGFDVYKEITYSNERELREKAAFYRLDVHSLEEIEGDEDKMKVYNRFMNELQMKSDYANRDSLKWIAAELKKNPKVADVAYQVDLMDSVNRNLTKMNLLLLVIAGLLTFVSFALISNFVRLSVYSRRFLIHTMKLVGASWGFIRRPFMKQGLVVGIIAAVLAIVVLGGCVDGLYYYEPNMMVLITWRELVITAVAVLLFGIIITSVSAYISVNRFLKMTPGELYKI
jgi:cell division transport system permease protein